MSLISVCNLTFCYDGEFENIFENVSFQIDTDWKLGFTGRNGRGKTTFMRLLLGELEYIGNISGTVNFEYFPYRVDDMSRDTIDIVEEIAPTIEQWQLFRELNLLEIPCEVLYRPFSTLSNGERTKVLLALMFLKENTFFLIDEPTNHLDVQAREITSRYLKSKKGFILISHDREFLDGCIDHILSINRTNIEIQRGNFTTWYNNKELQDQFELEQNEKLKKEIKRLDKAAQRTAKWSENSEAKKIGFNPMLVEKSLERRAYEGAKSKKMMSRSKVLKNRLESEIEEKSKLLKNLERGDELKLYPLKYYGDKMVMIENLSINYGENIVFEGISFTICQGERVALAGKNGCGKSSVLRLINGENVSYSGRIKIGSQLEISYVCQDFSEISGTIDEFCESRGLDKTRLNCILRKLDFSRTQFEKRIENYSSGQKKKLLIAASLCDEAHLYVWDEPLNFIDILSRIQIEKLICEYNPTLLFVEHDRAFCDKIATKTVSI